MELLSQFSQYLFSQKQPASQLTVKNYLSDIRKFIRWFEIEFSRPFSPSLFSWRIIQIYREKSAMQRSSLERSLSSLRKFASFLLLCNEIASDPFEELARKLESASKYKDKWRLHEFKNFLHNNKSSYLTIKNYIIDARQFIGWLEKIYPPSESYEVKEENLFEKIDPLLLEEYKARLSDLLGLSAASVNRKLSSLRRYFAFAQEVGMMDSAPAVRSVHETTTTYQPLEPQQTAHQLIARSQDLADLCPQVPNEHKKSYSSFPPVRMFQKMAALTTHILDAALILPIVKIASELHLLWWTAKGQPLFARPNLTSKTKNSGFIYPFVSVHNLKKEFYAPFSVGLSHLPLHKRLWHRLRHTRPKWYKRYHTYPLVHYFHFAMLMMIMTGIGIAIYRSLLLEPNQNKGVLASSAVALKTLSFQGRLTDAKDNPITNTKQLRFVIYNSETASGSARLWEEVRRVQPNSQGQFSAILGSSNTGRSSGVCNNGNPTPLPATTSCGIPQAIFQASQSLWLGITAESDPELSPRQQLATAGYASDAQMLQGLLPTTDSSVTTNTNALLALNSTGSLVIPGSSTTTFQAAGAGLRLTGQSISLTTNLGSGGDIIMDPEGAVDLRKGLVNNATVNNILTALGAVEVDDLFAVLASSSGQSAVTIDQTGIGPILSASVSGIAKFTLENTGAATFAEDLAVNGDDLTTTQEAFNLLNTNASTINFAGAASTISIGSASGTLLLRNGIVAVNGILNAAGGINITPGKNLTFSRFTSDGGILYTNGSGVVAQASAGSAGQCLQSAGGGTPTWGTCGVSSGAGATWTVSAGTLFPNQASVLDVLIGGTASNAAKFAFINTGSGTPTASISGNLSLSVPTGTTPEATLDILNNGMLNIRASPGGNAGLTSRLFISNNGNVGIGTTTPIAGLLVVNGAIDATFATANSERLCWDDSGASNITDCTGTPGDYAEEYATSDGSIEAGDVVIIDKTRAGAEIDKNGEKGSKAWIVKAEKPYQSELLGVISTNPNEVIGQNFTSLENPRPVALNGRIPVKVSSENGQIGIGDNLTSSSIPGVAMKATKAGQIIGKALSAYSDEGIGKIIAFVNISWFDPDTTISHTGNLRFKLDPNNKYSVLDSNGELIERKGIFSEAVIGNMKAGTIQAQSILIAGTSLKEYIGNRIDEVLSTKNDLISPISQADRIHTNIISPLSSDSILVNGKLTISHPRESRRSSEEGEDQIRQPVDDVLLDVKGSASVAGTLRAKKIIADEIEGLPQASVSATYITNTTNVYQTATPSAAPTPASNAATPSATPAPRATQSANQNLTPLPEGASLLSPVFQTEYTSIGSIAGMLTYTPQLQADFARLDSVEARLATFHQGVMVFGPTSLADVSVANQLAVGGNLILAENSINVLGADLEIQPFRQGNVSFMSGLVAIDTEGNFSVAGNANFAKDVSVKGKLSARFISPIPDEDLVIRLAGHPRESEDLIPGQAGNDKGQLVVQNASGSGVLKINQLGDLIASGSGTFNNLIANGLKVVRGVQADTSLTETVASSSAGTAIITRNQAERTVFSPFVKEDSLIYITPTSDTASLTPYIARQTAEDPLQGTKGSFTIQIPSAISKDIKVNWWIVN